MEKKTYDLVGDPYLIFEINEDRFINFCSATFEKHNGTWKWILEYEDQSELVLGKDLVEVESEDTIRIEFSRKESYEKLQYLESIKALRDFADNKFYEYVSYHKFDGNSRFDGNLVKMIKEGDNMVYEVRPRLFREIEDLDLRSKPILPNYDLSIDKPGNIYSLSG